VTSRKKFIILTSHTFINTEIKKSEEKLNAKVAKKFKKSKQAGTTEKDQIPSKISGKRKKHNTFQPQISTSYDDYIDISAAESPTSPFVDSFAPKSVSCRQVKKPRYLEE
jgi:AAA15 family ATPase/GTPase